MILHMKLLVLHVTGVIISPYFQNLCKSNPAYIYFHQGLSFKRPKEALELKY